MTGRRLERPTSKAKAARARDPNLDFIRTVAAFLVVSVHFFLNNGYYVQPLLGSRMLVMTILRMGFMVCVPLFLLLTGYLCRKKDFSDHYYLGLLRILTTYVLCAVWCVAVRVKDGELQLKGVWDLLSRLLDFSADSYAWYIEMYIGLFLLIPFLNKIWNGMGTRGERRALLVTLLGMTALPTVSNLFALGEHLFQEEVHYNVIPDWWIILYPVTYYFLGAWFGEYQPKIHWLWGIPALVGTVAIGGGVLFWLLHGKTFQWNTFNDWGGATVMLAACLLFLLLRQIPVRRSPRWFRWLLKKGSELSLGIYLISWRFDHLFYPMLIKQVPVMTDRLLWYFVIVPVVFLCSAGAAQLVEWVRKLLVRALNWMFPGIYLT